MRYCSFGSKGLSAVSAAVAASLIVLTSLCANAAQPAYTWSTAASTDYLDPNSYVLGTEFTATANVEVTALGWFDSYAYHNNLIGLTAAHDVGIYDMSGMLLTSATVAAGTSPTLIDSYRYTSVAPLQLVAGMKYIMAGVSIGGADPYAYGITSVTTAPGISIDPLTAEFIDYIGGSTLLEDPTNPYPYIYAGPNILVSGTSAVPEMSSVVGFGSLIALSGIGLLRRRRAC